MGAQFGQSRGAEIVAGCFWACDRLKFQTIGSTRYFDAAGYPGRTLGLD